MNSPPEDPLLRSARREAILVTCFGIAALTYTITACTWLGYDRPLESITFILGFPDWVFWGILAPWAVCTVVACYFSYVLMKDHDLEVESALFLPQSDPSNEANPTGSSQEDSRA